MESISDNEMDDFRPQKDEKSVKDQQMNNLKGKEILNTTRLSDFSNPVIKNYLKAKEQEIGTSSRKLNDLSKKPKNFQDLVKSKLNNSTSFSSTKSAPAKSVRISFEKSKKPHSACSKSPNCNRQDSTLNEFQIEKVVSWMTVNDDNFESEFEYSIVGQESDQKLTANKDDTYREISDFIKGRKISKLSHKKFKIQKIPEIEHDRNDSEDFKALKTDVEFKLNTILNSIESISSGDEKSPTTEVNDLTKLK